MWTKKAKNSDKTQRTGRIGVLIMTCGILCGSWLGLPQTAWAKSAPTAENPVQAPVRRVAEEQTHHKRFRLARLMSPTGFLSALPNERQATVSSSVVSKLKVPAAREEHRVMGVNRGPDREFAVGLLAFVSSLLFLGLICDLWREPQAYARISSRK